MENDGYVDKASLAAAQLEEDDVTIDGVGKFRVRALSRVEALRVRKLAASGDLVTMERRVLSWGLVRPQMTEIEIGDWQETAQAGLFETLTLRISELSGMTNDAAKEAYRLFEADPDAEFRVLPSDETGVDGGQAAG